MIFYDGIFFNVEVMVFFFKCFIKNSGLFFFLLINIIKLVEVMGEY